MRHKNRTDQVIARLASRSHGVVTRALLLDAGVTPAQIRARIARGSLIVVHPGVYRVGHAAPSIDATYMAAVLACGNGAMLMGAAAAHHYGLRKEAPPRPVVRARTERRIEGIETHRSRSNARGTTWRGIPITTVPQTLMDLDTDDLGVVCHNAQIRFGVRPEQTRGRVRAILEGRIPVTVSVLERRFLERLREYALPLPGTNRRTKGRTYVDCRWPEHRLTVELDGYRYHGTRHAFDEDRRREREAYARGDEHRRYTYRDVFEHPVQMLAELRALLA